MPIAESLALAGLRVIASPVLKKVVDEGFKYVGMDVPSELKDLVDIYLPQLVIATRAAEDTRIGISELKAWLQRLKDTYDEAEDILDEVEYQTIAKKIKREKREFMVRITSLPLVKPLTEFSVKKGKKLSFLSSKQRKLWSRLNKLKNDVKGLVEVAKVLYEVRTQPNESPVAETSSKLQSTVCAPVAETSSKLQSTIFVGRYDEHKFVVDELLKEQVPSEKEPYSVIAVVGIGGAGKTTLAQHIYHDHPVVKHFDIRMWVSLTRKMDVIKHTKAMIESASLGKEHRQSSTLEGLQSILVELLSRSKRVLLVLDDLWYNKSEEDLLCNGSKDEDWERLLAPLNSINGTKLILLTSRSKILPWVLESKTKFVNLGELTNYFAILLFWHHACLDKINESHLKKELEEISVQIVQNLSRLPLAIKSVATQLFRTREVSKWREILEGRNLNELEVALMWSYQQLDKALQLCFLSCSIFPKGHKFTKDGCLHRWLALNYIRSSDNKKVEHQLTLKNNDNKNFEDVGSKYFDDLVSGFFFQPADQIGEYYIMHDAFHDLAESLTQGECFRIENEQAVEIPSTVHHLSIAVRSIKEHVPSIWKLERLRTLIFLEPLEEDSREDFDKTLRKLKKLRILGLNLSPNITDLPETVCHLKYLKYLSFIWSSITQVPESLTNLHLLFILYLSFGIASLPKSMSNLRNLRHVGVFDKENGRLCSGLPPWHDVGKIASLQTLSGFHVRKEKGYELQQLGNLRELEGELRIYGLENVGHRDEAAEANLKDKNLKYLQCHWSEDLNGRNADFETLQALQPPQSLNILSIFGYAADRYPTWLGDEPVRHLRMLELDGCNFVEVLPSNLHLWNYCEEINLTKLRNLRKLPALPLCLKKLTILECPSLVLISEQEFIISHPEAILNRKLLLEKEFVFSKIGLFLEPFCNFSGGMKYYQEMMRNEREMFQQIGKLTEMDLSEELKILGCVQDNTLSKCGEQLKAWWSCHEERVNFIYNRVLKGRQFDLPSSLTDLTLSHCNITDRALSDCIRNLGSLKHLHLQEIMSLVSLPLEETMSQLSRLQFLTIDSCWLLRSLGALYKLYLNKLVVDSCPCLAIGNEKHGSPLPSSLQQVRLSGCTISSGTLCGELPKLNHVRFSFCRTSASLSVDKLTSVTSLELEDCPDICSLSGLYLLRNLEKLVLQSLPKLKVKDHLQSWPGCTEELHTDNLYMLEIFSSKTSVPPRKLFLEHLKEETITLENLSLLDTLEGLYFFHCKIKSIPTNFTNLSFLQVISFNNCPNISQLPELPKSVTVIKIKGCPVLKERCRRNGEDWPKIAHIKYKDIE